MKLKGRNIILTGASRGFGRYLADVLWKEGANLMMVARHFDDIPRIWHTDDGQHGICMEFDLERDRTSDRIVFEAKQEFGGRIDGLVNNAAILGPVGNSWENDWDAWLQALDINMIAPIRLCQLVAPIMLAQGSGSIVNLSGGGASTPRANYTAYATSKAGLVRFSETLATEMKMPGVRINCVAPGLMATQMCPDVVPDPSNEAMRDPADLIVYLLSDESDFITGRLISAKWDNWQNEEFRAKFRDPDFCTLRRCMDES